jgi:hypothetical protein
MRNGRIGGGLMIGGWALFALGIVLSNIAGSVIGGATMTAAFAVAGSGAAVLAAGGPAPLRGRVVRLGLALLAVGLIAVAGSSIAAARLSYDPLEDLPTVVLLLGGGLVVAIGMLLTQLALVRAGGLARRLGILFFAGLGVVYAMQVVAAMVPDAGPVTLAAVALSFVGAAGFAIGCAGPGILALRTDRGVSPAGS